MVLNAGSCAAQRATLAMMVSDRDVRTDMPPGYHVSMLSLVLPTYNESANIVGVLSRLDGILRAVPHEILVIDDDSPDRTWEMAERCAIQGLRVVRRIGRKGLSSAIVEGFSLATGDVLAVMDADGQHDASVLPRLCEIARDTGGLAVGSRYVPGGSVGEWNQQRHLLSRLATRLSGLACRVRVRDPMSGFFAIDRALYQAIAPRLQPSGFKMLLELLAAVPRSTPVTEVPYTFGLRTQGVSKLSARVQWQFLCQLVRLTVRRVMGS